VLPSALLAAPSLADLIGQNEIADRAGPEHGRLSGSEVRMKIQLDVNGHRRDLDVDAARTLLSVLRDELGLTGAKYGCGEGQCGACTVIVGQQAVRACSTPVSEASGHPITTIEGLEREGRLHPVQQAFLDEGAMQCGYCTPGMIMAAVTLLRGNPLPNEDQIVNGMHGNVCRCGTYPRIVAAVRRAASTRTARAEGRQ
jgi:aerobic-type carbon monoxide dehydrogenase small subunit (CoxS/CutS family)